MSSDIKQFIASAIRSVAQLEVLLLLQRDPQRQWTAAQVAQNLRASPSAMQQQLDELLASGLLKKTLPSGSYNYGPLNPELDRLTRELAHLYQVRRDTVISVIHAAPVQ